MPITIDNTNSVVSAGIAQTVSTSNTLTVAADGHLISSGADAVLLDALGGSFTLSILGLINSTAAGLAGLAINQDAQASVTVEESGLVRGEGQGIYFQDTATVTITNKGTIASGNPNYGAIFRGSSTAGALVVDNSGLITGGPGVGLLVFGDAPATVVNSGVVQGDFWIQSSGSAVDTVTNSGILRGGAVLGGGDDVITNIAGGVIYGTVNLESGNDTYNGGALVDVANGGADSDTLNGGGGIDNLIGEAGIDTLDGGEGADTLAGGLDNDNYVVEQGDTIIEVAGGGTNDSVIVTASFALASDDDIESLAVGLPISTNAINLTGNAIGQSVEGNNGANILSGLGGLDSLLGFGGNDRLIGGTGMDTQIGGAGNDRFVFKTAADSVIGVNRDVITDFKVAGTLERIDLSAFAGTFTFRGTGAFTSAGKEVKSQASGANTLVKIDLDADAAAEMEILLIGNKVLTAADFFL